jgi:hypothetical protein
MDIKTVLQLRIISTITKTFDERRIPYWIFGGFEIDGLLGKITREHSDIDFLVRFEDRDKVANIVTTRKVYDFFVIELWNEQKFVAYDPINKLRVDFGFVSANETSASLQIKDEIFHFPPTILPKDRTVTLENITFNILDPTFFYGTKLFSQRPENIKDKESLDKEEAKSIESFVDKSFLKLISDELTSFAKFNLLSEDRRI